MASSNGHRTTDPFLFPPDGAIKGQPSRHKARVARGKIKRILNSHGDEWSKTDLGAAAAIEPDDDIVNKLASAAARVLSSGEDFERVTEPDEPTEQFLTDFNTIVQWGGDAEGFLKDWRIKQLPLEVYGERSHKLIEIIELQHKGKSEKYITKYITERYDDEED